MLDGMRSQTGNEKMWLSPALFSESSELQISSHESQNRILLKSKLTPMLVSVKTKAIKSFFFWETALLKRLYFFLYYFSFHYFTIIFPNMRKTQLKLILRVIERLQLHSAFAVYFSWIHLVQLYRMPDLPGRVFSEKICTQRRIRKISRTYLSNFKAIQ